MTSRRGTFRLRHHRADACQHDWHFALPLYVGAVLTIQNRVRGALAANPAQLVTNPCVNWPS